MQLFSQQEQQTIRDRLAFDEMRYSIQYGGKALSFEKSPTLWFLLVELLDSAGVLNKEYIAHILWRNESYHPLRHDPRIFDLVKRLRKIIAHHQLPLILVSNSLGYRIVVADVEQKSA